jgi:glucose/arabinose dehydrogenase
MRGLVGGALALALLVGQVEEPRAVGTVKAIPVIDGISEGVVAFTFLPDGTIVYGERFTGNMYFVDPETGSRRFFFRVRRIKEGASTGLLGIAVHPDYPDRPYLYVFATRILEGNDVHNQIVRITDRGGEGAAARAIWTEDPVRESTSRNGGRILFGPDELLYAVVGDAVVPPNAQDLTNDPGKIHRMTATGGVPPGNPFAGSTIWAFGFRNSFGLDFDPITGNLWQSENGPDCNDELNLILKGANYGWGPISDANECTEPPPPPKNTNQDGPDPDLPEAWFTPTTAPVGLAFCDGCRLSGAEGTLLMGEVNTAQIKRVLLTADRQDVESVTVLYQADAGVPVSVETAPNGTIFFNDFDTIFRLVEGLR